MIKICSTSPKIRDGPFKHATYLAFVGKDVVYQLYHMGYVKISVKKIL